MASIARRLASIFGTSGTELSASVLPSTIPTGMTVPFAGSAAPAGWVLCNGQTLNRVAYAALFAAIGTTYGAGDGSTTFAVPDLRGRVVAGLDNMGGTAANRLTAGGSGVDGTTRGAAGGAETHTLSTTQMPSHTHSGTSDAGGSHSHTVSGATMSSPAFQGSDSGATRAYAGTQTTSTAAAHTHTFTTGSAGSGAAHNNTQPTLVLNYIIKT